MRIRRNATRRKTCRRMPTAYRRPKTQHRRNAPMGAPRKAAASFKHQTASTRMARIAATHRLPWENPAPMYVRFAIPRTAKRQCLCSGQPVPLPPNTLIRCITMPTASAARRQVRARSARNIKHRFSYRTKFQPVTDIPSRVGRIARMGSRNIFVRTAIIGIAMW